MTYQQERNRNGELLGICEHCGQKVTLEHWSINPTRIQTPWGTVNTVYDPECKR